MSNKKFPIAVLSFSRPDYLIQTLESLKGQDKPLDGRTIALFQDGPWSPSLKKNHVDPALCRRCVEVFLEYFPDGLAFESSVNLGAALNFERAERYVFETLDAPAAIFLEDDLVLGHSYLTVLEKLIDLSLADERIGYVAAFGNWTATPEEQLQSAQKLRPLHYQWGFGLTQRHWRKCRPYIQAYLDIVSRSDYRQRDHAKIQALVRSWGLEPADPNLPPAERAKTDTSQDRIKAFATALVGSVSLNTEVVYGQYIGKEGGLHFNTEIFERFRFHKTRHFDDALTLDFDLSSVNFDPVHPITHVFPLHAPKEDTALSATDADVAQWTRALYRIFLMREADPIGLSAHIRSLRAGKMTPEQLIRAFLQSTEFREKSSKFVATYLDDLLPQPEILGSSPDEVSRLSARHNPGDLVEPKPLIGHIVSLGTHCYTSWLLERMGLRKYALPFDYIFSDLEMIAECISDDFKIFLDSSQYTIFDEDGRCGHKIYSNKFNLPIIFNHHNVTKREYKDHFTRAVGRFRSVLYDDSAKLFLCISSQNRTNEKKIDILSNAIVAKSKSFRLIVIMVSGPSRQREMKFSRQIGAAEVYNFSPLTEMINGLSFADELDNKEIEKILGNFVFGTKEEI
jgi:hypothetical protein